MKKGQDTYIDKTDYSFGDPAFSEGVKRILAQRGDPAAYEEKIMELFYKSDFYEDKSNNGEIMQQQNRVTPETLN